MSTPHWKNKCSRDDKAVGKSESDTEIHHTHDGESGEDNGVPNDVMGNTPRVYTVSTKGEAFLETIFGLIMQQGINK